MLTYTLKIGGSRKFGGRTILPYYESSTYRDKVFLARPLIMNASMWQELCMALTSDGYPPINRWWKRGLGVVYALRKQTLRFHKDRSK